MSFLSMALMACLLVEEDSKSSALPDDVTFFSTATVEARPIESATSSVTVIDRATLEASGARSVEELLRFAAGVTVLGDASRGALNAAQIRGGDPNMSLVLIDGVAFNDATDQVGGAFNLASLPVSGIDRIEIARGPLSAVYGSTGLAGAIQVFTRQAREDEPRLAVELAAGDDSLLQASTSLGVVRETFDAFWDLSFQEESGRLCCSEDLSVAEEDRFESWNLYGRLGWKLGERSRLRFTTRASAWDGADFPEGSGGPRFGSGEVRETQHRETALGIVWEHEASPRRRSRGRLSWYRHDLDRQSPAIPPLVPPSLEETRFVRGRLSWLTTREFARLRWSVGADLDHERGLNDSLLFLPPFLGGTLAGDYDARRTTAGAFTEFRWERGDLTADLGLRADVTEDHGTEMSPRLGISYRPGGGATRIHASFGRSFKLPSFVARLSPPALGGNPALEPEVLVAADFGVEHFLKLGPKAGLHFDLTIYTGEFRDLIDFDFATFQNVNRNEVETKGAELSLSWSAGKRWRLLTAVAWQEVTDVATDQALRHRPEWSGSARLVYRAAERLSVALDLQNVSESLDEEIPVPDLMRVAGYQLYGAAVEWRFSEAFRLRLRADNLADKEYETLIGYPGPERAFRLALRYSY